MHRDEVGKYWIGDPPKLYYARILRSKTVMLRVGGGWQELGSFLSTHYNQLFTAENAREIARSAATSVSDPSTPKIYTQDLPGGERPWISASSLKATSSEAATRRHSFKSPRAVSLHMSPMRRSQTNSDLPFDLTSLMVKSTSHSPPATQPNAGQRNVSASAIPWRI